MANLNGRKFRKIPILITHFNDEGAKGYRAELADNYEDFKTALYEDLNFEDVGFHFHLPSEFETHEKDDLVFTRRKYAVSAAKYVNDKFLNNKAKIWF